MVSKTDFNLIRPYEKVRVYVEFGGNTKFNLTFYEGKFSLSDEYLTLYTDEGKKEIRYSDILYMELVKDTKRIKCRQCHFINEYKTKAFTKCKVCKNDIQDTRIKDVIEKLNG